MENKPKKIKLDPQIIRDLWSEDEKAVIKTIRKLRSTGNNHYIPDLLRLLNNSGKEVVEKELVIFLADIKSPEAKKFLIKGLKDPELTRARGNIAAVCWQSGMDFRQDLDLFVSLFLDGDYMTALECFTIIEESVMDMGTEDIAKVRELVIGVLDNVSEEKKSLTAELLKVLEV
jgi:hypothetical protein